MAVKVRQRDGKWWIFIDHNGKRKAKCIGDKRAAGQVAEKIQAKLALGDPPLTEEQILQARFHHLADISPHGVGPCVYFLQAQQGGPVKIGCTHDLARGLHTLSTGSPSPLRVLAIVAGGTTDTEAELHASFTGARLQGEWFRPTEEVVEYITRWCYRSVLFPKSMPW